MENLTFKLLKVVVRVYGAIIVLVLGSYFTLLLAHNDVILLKVPYHFEWVAGDIILLLIILWGSFFYPFKRWEGEIDKPLLCVSGFCYQYFDWYGITGGWSTFGGWEY